MAFISNLAVCVFIDSCSRFVLSSILSSICHWNYLKIVFNVSHSHGKVLEKMERLLMFENNFVSQHVCLLCYCSRILWSFALFPTFSMSLSQNHCFLHSQDMTSLSWETLFFSPTSILPLSMQFGWNEEAIATVVLVKKAWLRLYTEILEDSPWK